MVGGSEEVRVVSWSVAYACGLRYNGGRLARPFAHGGGGLERVAAGRYDGRLDEDQPEEFGQIARGVNQMAAALAWRERMQDQVGRLLAALNAPSGEATAAGGLGPAPRVLAAPARAPAPAPHPPPDDNQPSGAPAGR